MKLVILKTKAPVKAHLIWPDKPESTLCGLAVPEVQASEAVVSTDVHLCGRCEVALAFEAKHTDTEDEIKYHNPAYAAERPGKVRKDRRGRVSH